MRIGIASWVQWVRCLFGWHRTMWWESELGYETLICGCCCLVLYRYEPTQKQIALARAKMGVRASAEIIASVWDGPIRDITAAVMAVGDAVIDGFNRLGEQAEKIGEQIALATTAFSPQAKDAVQLQADIEWYTLNLQAVMGREVDIKRFMSLVQFTTMNGFSPASEALRECYNAMALYADFDKAEEHISKRYHWTVDDLAYWRSYMMLGTGRIKSNAG